MDSESSLDIRLVTKEIIDTIDRDREKEIISRRFGLYQRKETLEQIGELLGITRERVRQLEKAIVVKLKATADKDLVHIKDVERFLIKHLHELGRVAPTKSVAAKLNLEPTPESQAHIAFLATLAPGLTVVDENDHFKHSVGIKDHHDEALIKKNVTKVHETIKEHGKPLKIDELHQKVGGFEHPDHAEAYASVSKHLASLGGYWGLIKWPTVNPKNIRDKIYVILQEDGSPMHFSSIAEKIHGSSFKRKDVTTQAIHNELIKDKRFVLIGRGIYALKEWGYSKGTVADVIERVLVEEDGALHRDEIVKRVLEKRQVKVTTILLNLQGKPQFVPNRQSYIRF